MISKVITFKDNNNNALLPISDARAVQITYANVTKSVHDAILDTEEAIATTYNNLTSRIDGIEYDLNNPAVLNTNNTASQTPMSNERIEGNIYLHKVAKTGSWDDLNDKPTIPAVANNGRLTIQKNGIQVQTFTANQSTNVTANIQVAEPIIIEITGDGTQADPYTAQGSPYTIVTSAIDSLSNVAIWIKHNEELYSLVKDDTSNSIATFVHDSGDGTIKKFTVDDNDDITFSIFKSPKIENYGDDSTINNLAPTTDGDFAYSEDSGDLYYGDESCDGAYKRILTDDNISTILKTVNSTSLVGTGNIDAEDVILGKIVKESANPRIPSMTVDRFYKFLGTFSSSGGTLPVYVPDYSSTAETGNVNKIYVDITTRKAYWYDSRISINGSSGAFVELCQTDLSNYYTKSETDNALALKHDIDDVYVDQTYIDTNTTNSFASDNKRYNIVEDITLTTDATYSFGSGCILHFYNAGKLNGAANLELNNTQIESPMKQCFDLNVNFTGLMKNSECYPEWWGAKGDGETDDAAAINRCILCACHTPVVLTAENYLVTSTIGCEESIANSAANTAAHQSSVNYQYSSQLIIKHNIIGDATLTEPVVRFAVSHGLCNIYGSIIVRNSSDDCVGFTSFPSVGGEFGASNSEIYINTIFKGDWANHYYTDATYRTTYGVGNGVGAVLYQFNGQITIDYIGGFKHGVYMSRIINSIIHIGSCESTYCFYLGTPKAAWHNVNYNWYVTRNKVFLGKQLISANKNVNYIPFITDVADSAVIKEDGTQEISLNEFTIGDSNNANANLRHPHKHSLYYTYSSNAGHTGNVYNFNITYAIETSRKFVKFVFPTAPTQTNKGPNGDTINFGVGCFLQDIDIPYGWNVKLNNVILSNTAKTNGTYRWFGNSGEMLIDTVTITRASTPIFSSSEQTIKLLDINPQFRGSAVSVSTAPSTCANDKFYVVDNPITTNGTKKYPVYYKYFGTDATLIGYTLDDYKDKQNTLVSGTNIKTVNNESLLGSGNIDADDVILGKLVEEAANPHVPSITTKRFYKFLGTYTSSGGQLPIYTPDYSSTAESGNVNKLYVDIQTKKIYYYDSHAILGGFVELSKTDLSNYYTKSETYSKTEIDDEINTIIEYRWNLDNWYIRNGNRNYAWYPVGGWSATQLEFPEYPVNDNNNNCMKPIPVLANDNIYIYIYGGESTDVGRAWALTDGEGTILDHADGGEDGRTTPIHITAEQDGYLYISIKITGNGAPLTTNDLVAKIRRPKYVTEIPGTEVVTITQSNNTYSSTKTNSQITSLLSEGRTVVLRFGDDIYNFNGYDQADLVFTHSKADPYTPHNGLIKSILIDEQDGVHYHELKLNVSKVTVTNTTVSQTMNPDTLYIFGSTSSGVTSLTINGFNAGSSGSAEYYHGVVFCGANMTLSIPNTVVQSENRALPSFAAGDIFEFEILNIATNKYLMHFSHTPAS